MARSPERRTEDGLSFRVAYEADALADEIAGRIDCCRLGDNEALAVEEEGLTEADIVTGAHIHAWACASKQRDLSRRHGFEAMMLVWK